MILILFAYFCNDYFNVCFQLPTLQIMDIKDRIKLIMDREQLTASAFAESIGVSQATISHNIGDRNKNPSTDFIIRLHERYSNISLNWLLAGEGPMYVDTDGSSTAPEHVQNAENAGFRSAGPENRRDFAVEERQNATQQSNMQQVIYMERPARKITEIRIFFDDNTYETFKPEK